MPRINVPIAPKPVHTQNAVPIGMFFCAKYKNIPLNTIENIATTPYKNFCCVTCIIFKPNGHPISNKEANNK
jgi:hypothetical protein